MLNPMFVYDEQMPPRPRLLPVARVWTGCLSTSEGPGHPRWRPVWPGLTRGDRSPSDHGDLRHRAGHSHRLLRRPRSFFIPAAPTKAALLFDMVVGLFLPTGHVVDGSSRSGHRRKPGAPGTFRVAGLPAGAGGCFVSGGSGRQPVGLMVAREIGRDRGGEAPARLPSPSARKPTRRWARPWRPRSRTTAGAVPRPPAHRAGFERPSTADAGVTTPSGWWPPGAPPTPASSTTWGVADVADERTCGSMSTAPTAAPPSSPLQSGPASTGSRGWTRWSWTRTSGYSPPSTVPPSSTVNPPGQSRPRPGRLLPRRAPHRHPGRVEPQ